MDRKKRWRIYLIENDLTQAEVARRIGRSNSTLCEALSGRKAARPTQLLMVELLGIPAELVGLKPEKNKDKAA